MGNGAAGAAADAPASKGTAGGLSGVMSRSSSRDTIASSQSVDSAGSGGAAAGGDMLRELGAGRAGGRDGGGQRPVRRVDRRSKSYDCVLQHAEEEPAEAAPASKLLPDGMLFGIDIGGTLAKIVWREPLVPRHHVRAAVLQDQIARVDKYFRSQDLFPAPEHVDKSASMPNLEQVLAT